jgi:hypothetical protein
MPGHHFQHERETDLRPLPGPGAARRSGTPVAEFALDLQRRAGNRSVTELVGGSIGSALALGRAAAPGPALAPGRSNPVGVQREPCADCPDADVLTVPDEAEMPVSGARG